ncbi:MAG: response regulator [Chloroflexi bacterium]|nr:response regulator [Chloroflexota bacterium]
MNQIVLVIDDEKAIREAVTDILSLYDVPVLAAADGEQGTILYAQHAAAIGLILLDLTLPGLSGEATFYRLRDLNPHVPIIISSGYRHNSMNARFPVGTPFLPKPYDLARLTETVWQFLPKSPK